MSNWIKWLKRELAAPSLILSRIPQYHHLKEEVIRLREVVGKLRGSVERISNSNKALKILVSKLELRRENTVKLVTQMRGERVTDAWLRHLHRTYNFANNCVEQNSETNFDLCIAHDTYALVAADTFRKNSGAGILYDAVEVPNYKDRSITSVRALSTNPLASDFINEVELSLIKSTNAIITISPGLAEVIRGITSHTDPVVVRNCRLWEPRPVSLAIRKDCKCRKGDKVLLILNSVNFGDGFEEVLQGIKMLPRNIKVALVGGVYRFDDGGTVEDKLKKMALGGKVFRVGMRHPTELVKYISGADIVMVVRKATNLNNIISLPNRVFESVMARTPLLIPDIQDLRNITEKYNLGLIYDQGNTNDFISKIDEMLSDDYVEKMKVHMENVSQELSWETEQNEFLKAVNSALPENVNVCNIILLANKSLERNNRIYRMTSTLINQGHTVTVAANKMPIEEYRVKGVKYQVATFN